MAAFTTLPPALTGALPPPPPSAPTPASTAAAQHLIYLLLDSNLPTGGFVASGGLESYAKHGFLRAPPKQPYASSSATPPSPSTPSAAAAAAAAGDPALDTRELTRALGAVGARTVPGSASKTSPAAAGAAAAAAGRPAPPPARPMSAPAMGPASAGPAVVSFARAEMANFESSTGAYVRGAWGAVHAALAGGGGGEGEEASAVDDAVAALLALDAAHEATLLSHVARRASRAQGVALLMLHARGLGGPPPGFEAGEAGEEAGEDGGGGGGSGGGEGVVVGEEDTEEEERRRTLRAREIVAAYRAQVRRSAPGHLAVCFGVVTACLGVDLETTRHLYLFTHARATLSAAVRLNVIGPYLATQLLAYPLRPALARCLAMGGAGGGAPGGADGGEGEEWKPEVEFGAVPGELSEVGDAHGEDPWAWADEAERGPATTWPLGEILAARHDLQHSRIFNS